MVEVRGRTPEVMTTGGVKVELQLNAKVLDTAEAEVLAVVLISECEVAKGCDHWLVSSHINW